VPGLTLWGRFDADPRPPWGEGKLAGLLQGSLAWVLRRPKLVLLTAGLVSVPVALGAYRLQVESDFTSNFRQDSDVVRSYALVESNLGGAGVWDVILPAPPALDAEYLDRLRRLEGRLRREVIVADDAGQTVAGLTKVLGLSDILDAGPRTEMARYGLVFLASELQRRRLPWPAAMVAARHAELQLKLDLVRRAWPDVYALLYAEDPEQPGRHYARIMLRSRERQAAEQKQELIEQVRRIVYEEFPTQPDGERGEVTGFFVLLANLIESMIRDQWVTFGVAAGIVLIMLLIAFGNVWLAAAAIVLNSLSIMLLFGAMGWLGVKINMGSAMIAAVTMGLAVDSSIHYIVVYQRLRREGRGVREALDEVHHDVGIAAALSTLSLIIGFSALCTSDFVPLVYFGVLVSLAMLGGAVCNLALLPAVLLLTDRASSRADGKRKKHRGTEDTEEEEESKTE
jgi:predicted RND superfamily exporter protein